MAKLWPALHQIVRVPGHVVAQVVEAEFVVGAVGDVGGVGGAPLLRGHVRQDLADGQPEEAVYPAHPVTVSGGEVVVDRDHVHAVAGQGVEVGGQGRDQGLALAGLHLGDVAQMQRGTTHQLHLVVELAQGAARRLAHHRERLGQQLVQRLAVGVALLELLGERAQLGVGEVDVIFFEAVDVIGDRGQPTDHLAFACAQQLVENHLVIVRGRYRREIGMVTSGNLDVMGTWNDLELDELELHIRRPRPAAVASRGRTRGRAHHGRSADVGLPAAAPSVHPRRCRRVRYRVRPGRTPRRHPAGVRGSESKAVWWAPPDYGCRYRTWNPRSGTGSQARRGVTASPPKRPEP